MKIILTGGGTAGHVMVNSVLIPFLNADGWDIGYIGSHNGAEKDIIENQGIAKYYGISTGKLRRYLSFKNVMDFFKVWKGIWEAYRLLKRENANVVMSGGGFVSVPVVIAARILKIPVLIRETDMTIGLANKICMHFAEKIFVTFPDTMKYIHKTPCEWYGMIIRPELIIETVPKSVTDTKPTLLILGGSQGSEVINRVVHNNLTCLLLRYNIIHICGKGKMDPNIPSNDNYQQYEYVEDIGEFYSKADVIITRCGSNAISEGLSLGKRMICIPLTNKYSRGEQVVNAQYAIQNGCATMLTEEQLCLETLINTIEKIIHKPINNQLILDHATLINNCNKHITDLKLYAQKNEEAKCIKKIDNFKKIDWENLSDYDYEFYKEILEIHGE